MQITIGGRRFRLNNREVRAAKKLVLEQLRICREKIDADVHPSVYLTYLLLLHIMSGEAIEAMDLDAVANALEVKERFEKENAGKQV